MSAGGGIRSRGTVAGRRRLKKRKIRVLVAKPGLDGHDLGAKVVARVLMDAGFEVLYTGLRQTPEMIARIASQEGVDVIGLSMLSGSHIPLCRKLAPLLREHGIEDKIWIVGGNIPKRDHSVLKDLGVAAVFRTGSRFEDIIGFIRDNA